MLSAGEARQMEGWLEAARCWSETTQALVAAATELATNSRDLADDLDAGPPAPLDPAGAVYRAEVARDLLRLADSVEEETREARNGYLATAARLAQYSELPG